MATIHSQRTSFSFGKCMISGPGFSSTTLHWCMMRTGWGCMYTKCRSWCGMMGWWAKMAVCSNMSTSSDIVGILNRRPLIDSFSTLENAFIWIVSGGLSGLWESPNSSYSFQYICAGMVYCKRGITESPQGYHRRSVQLIHYPYPQYELKCRSA